MTFHNIESATAQAQEDNKVWPGIITQVKTIYYLIRYLPKIALAILYIDI